MKSPAKRSAHLGAAVSAATSHDFATLKLVFW